MCVWQALAIILPRCGDSTSQLFVSVWHTGESFLRQHMTFTFTSRIINTNPNVWWYAAHPEEAGIQMIQRLRIQLDDSVETQHKS